VTPSADRPIDWKPLERFCELAASRGVTGFDADDFMWMGWRDSPAGVPVQLYKHIDTRRYLNLDASGHAYVWRSGDDNYHLTSPAAAIDCVTGPGSSTAVAVAAGWSARPAALPDAPVEQAPADPGLAL
jgi:hypothetical protein